MNTEQRNLLRSLIEPLIKNTNDNLVINATVGCKANNSFRYQGLSVTALCDIYPGNKVWVFRDTKSGAYYGVREEFNPILNERKFTRKATNLAKNLGRPPFSPGLYLLFDNSWWNIESKLNSLLAQDFYTCTRKKIYYLSMSDNRVSSMEGVNPTEQFNSVRGAKKAGARFEEFSNLDDIKETTGSVILFPLLDKEARLKLSEVNLFTELIKKNKVLIQGEASDWETFNIETISRLGLSNDMTDQGDFTDTATIIKNAQVSKILDQSLKSNNVLAYEDGRSFKATDQTDLKKIFPFVKQEDNQTANSGMFWYSQVVNPLPPGLFIVFDVNWWTINSNLSNFAIDLAKDIYRNAEKKIYYLNDDRIYLLEGAATVFPNLQIVSAAAAAQIEHSFIEVPTFQAVEEITNSTFIVPLFMAGTDITVQEANIIKNLAKNNRIFYQCEWNTWGNYNLRVLSKLGLSSYLTDLGNSSSSMSAILLDTPDVARIAPTATETGGSMFFNATRIFQTSNIDLVFPVIRPLEVSGDTTGMMFYVDPSVLIPS